MCVNGNGLSTIVKTGEDISASPVIGAPHCAGILTKTLIHTLTAPLPSSSFVFPCLEEKEEKGIEEISNNTERCVPKGYIYRYQDMSS